jgi:hypothetical protein
MSGIPGAFLVDSAPNSLLDRSDAMSPAEQSLLAVFRMFQVTPGRMLCFFGPELEKHDRSLTALTQRGWLTEERFHGGYSLTEAGFAAMKAAGRS